MTSSNQLTSMFAHDYQEFAGWRKLETELKNMQSPFGSLGEQMDQLLKPQLLAAEQLRKLFQPQQDMQQAFKRMFESVQIPQMNGFEKLGSQLQPTLSRTLTSELALSQNLEYLFRPLKVFEEPFSTSMEAFKDLLDRHPFSSLSFDQNGAVSVSGELVSTESLQQAIETLEVPANDTGALIEGLLQQVAKLGPALRTVVLFILLSILLPYIISIVANLTTPLYEPLWKELSAPNGPGAKAQIREVARERFSPDELRDHRFVTAKKLTIRQTPRQNAPPVGALNFGKTVRLLKHEKDWSFIEYVDEDGTTVSQGWVLARYLVKFG